MAKITALSVAMAGICAALYALIGRLTDLGITFGGVAFWPAAVIPAVFSVLFGPWVGGTGAAIGIFIRDMMFHGDALLSLSAGVTANFAGGFLIGYFARTSLNWKRISTSMFIGGATIVVGLFLPTVLLPMESEIFTGWSAYTSILVFAVAVIASIAIMMAVAKFWPEWRSYAVGSIIGLGVASLIIALVVWGYSQIFFSPQGYLKEPIPPAFMPLIFVWTFATEIPFVLLLGPPIIKACRNAFPSLTAKKAESK
ncbi:MAG: ECF transporter S component [Candidatus Bathycorpusculaceae bacterium]